MNYRAVGVDGCRGGWVAVAADGRGRLEALACADLEELWHRSRSAERILIDMPIGLCDGLPGLRECDQEARRILNRARNRVFWAPCRAALDAKTHAEASRVNRRHTGRGLSIQAWCLVPKIRQVDAFLRRHREARGVVRECHPEVCFAALAGRPMHYSKKKREGIAERLDVLEGTLPGARRFYEDARTALRRLPGSLRVQRDDLVDAMAACATAMRPDEALRTIPPAPPRDSSGLPMEMVVAATG